MNLLDKLDFKTRYLQLKQIEKTDREIAKEMFMGYSTLQRYKKDVFTKEEIKRLKKPMRNKQGITEEHFAIAKANGLDKYLVLHRVRDNDWTIPQAIKTPKIPNDKKKDPSMKLS